MSRQKSLFALSALLLTAACGGSEPAAKAPEAETAEAATATPTEMPPPAPTAAETPAPPPPEAAPAPPQPKIDVAAMKFSPKKGGKARPFEVKGDGTVTGHDGKTLLRISGDHIEDASGKTLVTLGSDGSLMGEFKGTLRMMGDDVVGDDEKISVGDDGTVTMTRGKKTEPVGKFEGSAGAKKTAALVMLALHAMHHEQHHAAMPKAQPKHPAAAKPAAKPKP
ncbi:MAG: hypothetical protein FWD73_09100 [Polyangiaceae bacterium]|nr:hypothetical protein [Polyangiaceae bacterium]